MKRVRMFLMAMLLLLPMLACTSWNDIPSAPAARMVATTTYQICFVDAWSGYVDCGWYPYNTFGLYSSHFQYYRSNGVHFFYHNNWMGSNGVRMTKTTPIRQGRMIKGQGTTRGGAYKEDPSVTRRAVPRNQTTLNTPQARETPQNTPTQRRAVPRAPTQPQTRVTPPQRQVQPRVAPPQRQAQPRMSPPTRTAPPKATPPKRVVKPRGGGGGLDK